MDDLTRDAFLCGRLHLWQPAKGFRAATDPVLMKGEMVAEYHRYYGSAALIGIREVHERLGKKQM